MTATTTAEMVGDIATLIPDFERSLPSQNLSPKTIRLYGDAIRSYQRFALAQGMPTAVAKVRREHVEAYMESIIARLTPATVNQTFRSLAAFWKSSCWPRPRAHDDRRDGHAAPPDCHRDAGPPPPAGPTPPTGLARHVEG